MSIAAGQNFEPLSEHQEKAKLDYRPTWEQWASKDESTVVIRPREDSGAVSVQQLRKPLKGKSRELIEKAERFIAKGKRAEALVLLEEALERPDARPYAYSIMGTEHLKMGLLDQAIFELEQALPELPGRALIHNNLAYALGIKGDLARARKEAAKALQLDPGNAKTRYIMGTILVVAGEREEAIFHLRLAADKIDGARELLDAQLGRESAPQPPAGVSHSFQAPAK